MVGRHVPLAYRFHEPAQAGQVQTSASCLLCCSYPFQKVAEFNLLDPLPAQTRHTSHIRMGSRRSAKLDEVPELSHIHLHDDGCLGAAGQHGTGNLRTLCQVEQFTVGIA